ncbi:4Fe-4S dicluster domain-containing protein [Escherichia coli]|nr:4Fe-4S dicluster domain-containing protein [Escherichia coli]ELD5283282.1 4Fe-4S dicluster domain-containing protein [Escherichia coli]
MLSHNITIGAECARQRFRFATCHACVEACPAQALTLTEEGIAVDAEQCIDCAVCQFICPQEAIRGVNSPLRYFCNHTLVAPFTTIAPTLEELLLWHKEQGITAIAIDLSQAKAWERALLLLNECLRQYGEEGWSVVSPHTSEVNVSRRRLFHVQRADVQMTQIQPGLRRLHYLWPQISDARPMMDPQKCQLCGACWRACEQQVFSLNEGHLQINDALCNGCQNCISVCFHQAMTVELTILPAKIVNLHANRKVCKTCQKSFLTFQQNAQNCLYCQRHRYGMRTP